MKGSISSDIFHLNKKSFSTLQTFSEKISHDLNNHLTVISGNITIALMDLQKDSSSAKCLLDAQKSLEKIVDFTKLLSQLSHPVSLGNFSQFNLSELVLTVSREVFSNSVISFETNVSESNLSNFEINAEMSSLIVLLKELLFNAEKFSRKNVTLNLKFFIQDESSDLPLKNGKYIEVSIFDDGCGMSDEILAKIFDPFFTTNKQAMGLGLSYCFAIVKGYEGYLDIKSFPGKGTKIKVYLPQRIK